MGAKNKTMSENQNTLPTIAELYSDNIEVAFKNDRLNKLVNTQPKKEWIKENKYAGNSSYIPIGIVESLIQKVFKQYKIEVIREGTMFNSVYCTIRLHYWNGIENTWNFHDGVGAVQLQTKSGSSPAQLENINNNAVMMALPMAKSYAIKDAAEHIGALFGRDLNRKDVMNFTEDLSLKDARKLEEITRMSKWINECTDVNLFTEAVCEIAKGLEIFSLILDRKKELSNG